MPQGSTRAFVVGKRAVVVSANKPKLREWRAVAVDVLTRERDRQGLTTPYTGAVSVTLMEYRLPPKGSRRVLPSVRPDLDKIDRAIGDVLVQAGILKDDALICERYSKKLYGDRAEVRLLVEGMG